MIWLEKNVLFKLVCPKQEYANSKNKESEKKMKSGKIFSYKWFIAVYTMCMCVCVCVHENTNILRVVYILSLGLQ